MNEADHPRKRAGQEAEAYAARLSIAAAASALVLSAIPMSARGEAVGVPELALCFGRHPTLVGTAGPDRLIGSDGDDIISGLDGEDVIYGRGGRDAICAGRGADVVMGGDGADAIEVGAGADIAKGGRGNDLIVEFSDDAFYLVDTEVRDHDRDILGGGPGHDRLSSEGGNDRVDGGDGQDLVFHLSSFSQVLIDLEVGIAVSGQGGVDQLRGVEHVVGSVFEDVLRGDEGANAIYGLFGRDLIESRDGNDLIVSTIQGSSLDGGTGLHDIVVAPVENPISADLGLGLISYRDASTRSDVVSNIEDLIATPDDDLLVGSGVDNLIIGSGGDDRVRGVEGDDQLFGDVPAQWRQPGGGEDYLDGGPGEDFLAGGPRQDICVRGEIIRSCGPPAGEGRSLFPRELLELLVWVTPVCLGRNLAVCDKAYPSLIVVGEGSGDL